MGRMREQVTEPDWLKQIQTPNPGWQKRPNPVVKLQKISSDGQLVSERLYRVSPRHKPVDGGDDDVVSLDCEIVPGGGSVCISEVEVDTLALGGWTNDQGVTTRIEFAGLTKNPQNRDKRWSYTF